MILGAPSIEKQPEILIVGAGSVGQVYGRHLQMAGARVTFFVREKYIDSLKNGFQVYPLNETRSLTPTRVSGFEFISNVSQVEARQWSQVYLCISTAGLQGDWLEPFLKAVKTATVISILPGLEDKKKVLEYLPENQLVSGTVSFASYNAPLKGEKFSEKGMAYWFFPMAPNQYSSIDRARASEVVRLLKKGQMPAKQIGDIAQYLALSIASTEVLIVALEIAGWKFSELRGDLLREACLGTKEAIRVAAKSLGIRTPIIQYLITPLTIRIVQIIAPFVMAFPFEEMLHAHYTKVRAQTHHELDVYISTGERLGVSVEHMKRLREKIKL